MEDALACCVESTTLVCTLGSTAHCLARRRKPECVLSYVGVGGVLRCRHGKYYSMAVVVVIVVCVSGGARLFCIGAFEQGLIPTGRANQSSTMWCFDRRFWCGTVRASLCLSGCRVQGGRC